MSNEDTDDMLKAQPMAMAAPKKKAAKKAAVKKAAVKKAAPKKRKAMTSSPSPMPMSTT